MSVHAAFGVIIDETKGGFRVSRRLTNVMISSILFQDEEFISIYGDSDGFKITSRNRDGYHHRILDCALVVLKEAHVDYPDWPIGKSDWDNQP